MGHELAGVQRGVEGHANFFSHWLGEEDEPPEKSEKNHASVGALFAYLFGGATAGLGGFILYKRPDLLLESGSIIAAGLVTILIGRVFLRESRPKRSNKRRK